MKYYIGDIKKLPGKDYKLLYSHYINNSQIYYNIQHGGLLFIDPWNFK